MKRLLIIFVSTIFTSILFGQGEIDDQQKVFFRNEKSLSLTLRTDGFGFGYREGKRIDYLNKKIYELDFGTFKHPKELKTSSYYVNSSYIFGKINSAFYLSGGMGAQHEVFKKADLGGIAVRYFYSGGLSLGLYKPIYYKVVNIFVPTGTDTYYIDITEEKFEESIQSPEDIYSKSAFTKGLREIKVIPGVYAKTGLNFEYSIEDKAIQAVEVGAQISGFPRQIPIMSGDNNKAIFFSLFVSYRIGIIVDPLSREKTGLLKIFNKKSDDIAVY